MKDKIINLTDEQLETISATDPIRLLLYQAESYKMGPFLVWAQGLKSAAARKSAATYPPNRVYRVDTGDLCYITGYAQSGKVAIMVPNGGPMSGIDPIRLEDVTEDLRDSFGLRNEK